MTRESGLQMPNNEWHQVLSGLSGVIFGTGVTVHADAAEAEEVIAASLQHLRMETLAILSRSLFFLKIPQQRSTAVLSGISHNI